MWYDNDMSTPAGALSPTVIPGEVVTPAAVVGPLAFPGHAFFNTVRHVITRSGTFHGEDELKNALHSVDAYEKAILKADHKHVQSEDDFAPHEDVSLRVPPRTGYAPVPTGAPAIDYNRLAAALMAAGFGQQNQEEGPTE
jgi:hypothetical protein